MYVYYIYTKFVIDNLDLSFLFVYFNGDMKGKRKFDAVFPNHGDKKFGEKLMQIQGVRVHQARGFPAIENKEEFDKQVAKECGQGDFELMMHQLFVQYMLSRSSPYRGMLLYHQVGLGKTCTALTVAEDFLQQSIPDKKRPPVLVLAPKSLLDAFQEQLYNSAKGRSSCVGDTYRRMVMGRQGLKEDEVEKLANRVIASRFQFSSYDEFSGLVERLIEEGGNDALRREYSGRLIIIDEAHNVRSTDEDKHISQAIEAVIANAEDTRLLLLSATPMYNDAKEILWLLHLLALNDRLPIAMSGELKRMKLFGPGGGGPHLTKKALDIIAQLSSEYVSYLRGSNPFTFPVRVMPSQIGIETLKKTPTKSYSSSNSITDPDWIKKSIDIVPCALGEKQLAALASGAKRRKKVDNSELNTRKGTPIRMNWELDVCNVVYPNDSIQGDGFYATFEEVEDKPMRLRYRAKYASEPFLAPANLPRYSGKISRIVDLVQKAEGIVIIFSRHIYQGIIPLSVALEHAGFDNSFGNILISGAPAKRNGMRYTIICGDKRLTPRNPQDIVEMVNAPDNADGSRIKVVILSRVAGEGFSFRNAREMHILDPWFHANRNEQVIGRAVRTCSHASLPFEQRNVTIFQYAAIDTSKPDKETVDVYCYRMSAEKTAEIRQVESVVRENAMDCVLQTAKNHVPRSLFGNRKYMIETSRKNRIQVEFGDPEEEQYTCKVSSTEHKLDTRGWRLREYAHMIPTIQRRIKRALTAAGEQSRFTIEDLLKYGGVDENPMLSDVVFYAVLGLNGENINGREFIAHHDGFTLVQKRGAQKIVKIKVIANNKENKSKTKQKQSGKSTGSRSSSSSSSQSWISELDYLPYATAKVQLYLLMTPTRYDRLAQSIIRGTYDGSLRISNMLQEEGAFVYDNELRSSGGSNKIVGYIDIFAIGGKLAGKVLVGSAFKSMTSTEIDLLMKKRHHVPVNTLRPTISGISYVGFISAEQKKGMDTPAMMFKMFDSNTPTSRGFVCHASSNTFSLDAMKKQVSIITGVPEKAIKGDKRSLCNTIAYGYTEKNQMLFPPYFKQGK